MYFSSHKKTKEVMSNVETKMPDSKPKIGSRSNSSCKNIASDTEQKLIIQSAKTTKKRKRKLPHITPFNPLDLIPTDTLTNSNKTTSDSVVSDDLRNPFQIETEM